MSQAPYRAAACRHGILQAQPEAACVADTVACRQGQAHQIFNKRFPRASNRFVCAFLWHNCAVAVCEERAGNGTHKHNGGQAVLLGPGVIPKQGQQVLLTLLRVALQQQQQYCSASMQSWWEGCLVG